MRDAANVEMHELEARFGTVTENGRFESSVDVTYFNQCLSMCDTYTEWDKIVPWHTRKDFFYNNFVRTMVYPKLNGTAITQCVIKKKKKNLTTKICHDYDAFGNQNIKLPNAFRVSLNSEENLDCKTDKQDPTYFRHKITKNYRTKSGWSIDFSKTYSVSDRNGVQREQKNRESIVRMDSRNDYKYEIEIELSDVDYIYRHSSDFVAESIVLKLFDFIPMPVSLVTCS